MSPLPTDYTLDPEPRCVVQVDPPEWDDLIAFAEDTLRAARRFRCDDPAIQRRMQVQMMEAAAAYVEQAIEARRK